MTNEASKQNPVTVTYDESFDSVMDAGLAKLKAKLMKRAEIFATDSSTTKEPIRVSLIDLTRAIDEILDGRLLHEEPQPKWYEQFFKYFPPFTCLCAILCLAFAALGLLIPTPTDQNIAKTTGNQIAGFLDIAKIFAGAIVGSTASIALVQHKPNVGSNTTVSRRPRKQE